ncbi:hypothetical protein [Helicobacter sp. 23-1045]
MECFYFLSGGGGICIFVLLKIFCNFSRIYKISPHFYEIFGAESNMPLQTIEVFCGVALHEVCRLARK